MTSRADSHEQQSAQQPELRREDLFSIFDPRDPVCERVGLELEKFAVLPDGRSLPVIGPQSIRTVLERLEKRGWKAEREGEWIIALRRSGQIISVEPGGQLELSTPPSVLLDEAYQAEQQHLYELEEVTKGWGVSWCGAGVRPMDTLNSIGWVPKRRYLLMRDHLGRTGDLAHWMMKMTASLQVSVDYTSETDAALKLRVLARLSPVLTALSAASPVVLGKPSGYMSYRSRIWSRTDPARCGLPEWYFKDDFRFEDYVEYALDVPSFFIERQGRVLTVGGLTFREFMRSGYLGYVATLEDWRRHLTFLFPEIRLKGYIEIRSCDRQPGISSFAIAAFIKSMVYSKATLARADERLRRIAVKEAEAGMEAAARLGLEGIYAGRKIREWATELLELGRSGLILLREAGRASELELEWFRELESGVIRKRRSTAEELLRALEQHESLERIVRLQRAYVEQASPLTDRPFRSGGGNRS